MSPARDQWKADPLAATYRVQLTPHFGFSALRDRIDYLRRLGISTVYTSPILQARSGSEHGYDVIDPTRLNAELGTDHDFEELVRAVEAAGMGLLIDIVPNHMAASAQNPWWTDVLRQGPDSPFASYFDVDWSAEPIRENLSDKVLLPILGKPYGDVLEDQELRIVCERGAFRVVYYDRRLPLNFSSYVRILHEAHERLRKTGDADSAGTIESILLTLNEWAHGEGEVPSSEEIDQIHHRITSLIDDHPPVESAIDRVLRILNGQRGNPESFDELDTILEEQSYRLSFWRNAAEEINYRRFFDITDLVSIRVTDPEVFDATHRLILELVGSGAISGLRLDHIDGLYDPALYLEMLGRAMAGMSDTLIVSEKILGEHEVVPEHFRYRGTTGYDFARDLDRVFVDPEGFGELESFFANAVGIDRGFHAIARQSKIAVIHDLFRGELASFTRRFVQLTAGDRHAKDLPISALEEALVQFVASLPVYRTYVSDHFVSEHDFEIVEQTVGDSLKHLEGDAARSAIDFLQRVLTLDTDDESQLQEWRRFTMRFQQFTGPIAAKGVEDTALYVYTPLVSLNEVGAEPRLPSDSRAAFHAANSRRLSITPDTLNAASTHDSKRGEETRCRLHVLSEIPETWMRFHERWGSTGSERGAPSVAERWFFLQNLAGIWPLEPDGFADFEDRVTGYAEKALREAKLHSHWTGIDEGWEKATTDWLRALMKNHEFRSAMESLQTRIAFPGMLNSLAATVLRIASPGIPDIYQGAEMWNFSLVDPDNRRPVDFDSRSAAMSELEQRSSDASAIDSLLPELMDRWREGRIKLWTVWRGLLARRSDPELFRRGEYIPLDATAPADRNVIAFARRIDDRWAIAVAPRHTSQLVDGYPLGDLWHDTRLLLPEGAPRRWTSSMTGRGVELDRSRAPLSRLLSSFPVEILTSGLSPAHE